MGNVNSYSTSDLPTCKKEKFKDLWARHKVLKDNKGFSKMWTHWTRQTHTSGKFFYLKNTNEKPQSILFKINIFWVNDYRILYTAP